ncbi:unnamed protein product [Pedinophyceae sp. YPF-701]|nr:unnamed protein product [Pedinophyceae sp. YPF-701]
MSGSIQQLLDKLKSSDKDIRYMAASDLLGELQSVSTVVAPALQDRLTAAFLELLVDQAGDVASLAVRCLPPLLPAVGEAHVAQILDSLTTGLRSTSGMESQLRDNSAMALKSIATHLHAGNAVSVRAAQILTPRLLEAAAAPAAAQDTAAEALTILAEVLDRLGHTVRDAHADTMTHLLPLLESPRETIRRRAAASVAALAPHMTDAHLEETVQVYTAKLQAGVCAATFCQGLAGIVRSVRRRFAPFLGATVPLAVDTCNGASEEDSELRENCLLVLEMCLQECGPDASAHVQAACNLAVKQLSFDPHYSYSDSDEEEEAGSEDDYEEEEEVSDDDDTSWKVRRAATRVLMAATAAHPSQLEWLVDRCLPVLVGRTREREESIRVDVLQTAQLVVKQVGAVRQQWRQSGLVGEARAATLLRDQLPALLQACLKQLRSRSHKSRQGAVRVVRTVVDAIPEALSPCIREAMPAVAYVLADQSTAAPLRLEALTLLSAVRQTHPASDVAPFVGEFAPLVAANITGQYFKVSAEALRCVPLLISALRPAGDAAQEAPLDAPTLTAVQPMIDATVEQVRSQDQDQEVRAAAIAALADILSCAGDAMAAPLTSTALSLLLDRLNNESTRLRAVQAFATIARSKVCPDLGGLSSTAVETVAGFLRKSSRALRGASLAALEALVLQDKAGAIPGAALAAAAGDVASILESDDMQLVVPALRAMVAMLRARPGECSDTASGLMVPPALKLLGSPMLSEHGVAALQDLFREMVAAGAVAAADALARLSEAGATLEARGSQLAVAKCMAAVALASGPDSAAQAAQQMAAADLSAQGRHAVHLLAVGEIARRASIPGVEPFVLTGLGNESSSVKAAASVALGALASGDLHKYLPLIIKRMSSEQKHRYLLLHALLEVIRSMAAPGANAPAGAASTVMGALQSIIEATVGEEGIRNVVSECLGSLAQLAPREVVPWLSSLLQSPKAELRAASLSALRHVIIERRRSSAVDLPPLLATFLEATSDDDLNVQRASLQLAAAALHHVPALVTDLLPSIVPRVLACTRLRKELLKVVELGPFKVTVDRGAEVRKAALECCSLFIDRFPAQLDGPALIEALVHAVEYKKSLGTASFDVVAPALLALSKLVSAAPAIAVGGLDAVVEVLDDNLSEKPKTDAVKHEEDRFEDMHRGCLRLLLALSALEGAQRHDGLRKLLESVQADARLASRLEEARADRLGSLQGL